MQKRPSGAVEHSRKRSAPRRDRALASVVALVACLCLAACPVRGGQKKRVLYLDSYHRGYAWSDNVQAGIRSVLDEAETDLELHVEYMDSKYHGRDEIFPPLEAMFAAKYSRDAPADHFDVIILSDNNALDFMLPRRETLFPGVPIVFCGINGYDPGLIAGHSGITGVAEELSQRETIELILKLHSDTERIAVVSDGTTTGMANMASLRQVMGQFPSITFEVLDRLTTAKLVEALRALPARTVVFHNAFYNDGAGKEYTVPEATALVAESSGRPVYSTWGFVIDGNVVGGVVISGAEQGRAAAGMALRILQGESAGDIPVMTASPNVPMFHYDAMAQFGLVEADLPAGSVVLGKPFSVYEEYKVLIWTVISAIGALLLLVVMLTWNIIYRHRVEARLRASERYSRMLFEESPIGLNLCRMDGRWVQANRALARTIGYSVDEALELSYWDLTPDKYAEDEKRVLEALEKTGRYGPYEKEYIHKDGHLVPVSLSGVIIERNGERFIWSSIEDITERKSLADRLRQSQKMEALGQLAGGIAHDFNNVLTAIQGNADLVELTAPPESRVIEFARQITVATQRAADMTSQLLAFARKGQYQTVPVGMHEIIADVVGLLAHSIDRRITVALDLQAEKPTVMGDPAQLQNALLNLGVNARDAMPDGGKLTYATRNITLDEAFCEQHSSELSPGPHVEISVADTGVGMTQDVCGRAFEPFFTTKDVGKGTGLGLAGVYGTVAGHHGYVRIYSEPGIGTTLKVLLPAVSAAPPPAEAAGKAEVVHGVGHILLVDDEDIVRNYATPALEEMGYTVTPCVDGAEAVEYYRTHHGEIDLVVMDLIMPNLDGAGAFVGMKQINADVRVLLSSGFTQNQATQDLIANGARGFISKPFRITELSQAVARCMAS